MQLHVIITREDEMFVAQAVEIDVASQGMTEDEALANLREAVELVLEDGGPAEIARLVGKGATVASLEVHISEDELDEILDIQDAEEARRILAETPAEDYIPWAQVQARIEADHAAAQAKAA